MRVRIVEGGIGGLVAALALHRASFDVHVFETARDVKPLGVGINLRLHIIAGGRQIFVAYPISKAHEDRGRALVNRIARPFVDPGQDFPRISDDHKRVASFNLATVNG
jgi:2-polyprenyl-6-methoxyphenol hydroxylase-like FAD-dependent oxidoreductase